MARARKIGRSRLKQAWYYFSQSIRTDLTFPPPVPDEELDAELERLAGLYTALRRGPGSAEAPEKPDVSVVIPVHFAEPTDKILRTMQTLLTNRDAPPTEVVIVVNGKATTPDLLVCEPYRVFQKIGVRLFTMSYLEDERYHDIVRPAYIFVPKQRGAEESLGEVILGTDVDNVFRPTWIRDYKDAFDEDPGLLAAYGPVQLYGDTNLIGKFQTTVSSVVKAGKILFDFPPYAGHNHALRASTRDQVPDMYNQIIEDCHESPAIIGRHMHLEQPMSSFVRCIPGAVISTYFTRQTQSVWIAIRWIWRASGRNIANWRRVLKHRKATREEGGRNA